jgi:hypothetical protein
VECSALTKKRLAASAPFLEFWGVPLNPAIDRRVIHLQSSFPHHFLEVTVAECIPQVPTHAQVNDLGFEVTLFERTLLIHEENPSAVE